MSSATPPLWKSFRGIVITVFRTARSTDHHRPEPRELLRSNPLGIAKDMRVVLERDIRVSMSHKPGNDVNRGAGLEQFGRDSMPEAVDANVGATAPWPRPGTNKIYFVLASAMCHRIVLLRAD
jgi:hypothetical protein